MIARPVRRAARAAARWTRSSRAETHGLSVPISPMIPGRIAGLPHPVGRLSDELVGQVVDRSAVDPQPRPGSRRSRYQPQPMTMWSPLAARDARQPAGVAPDAGQRQVDQAAAAGRPVCRQLLEDQRLVAGQLPVVPAVVDVPEGDLGVLVRQREPELGGLDRTEDGLDVGHGPRCYAVAPARLLGRVRRRAGHRGRRAPAARSRPAGSASPASIRWRSRPSSRRQEAAGEAVDVEPGRQLAASDALAEQHRRGPDELLATAGEHLADAGLADRPPPRPGPEPTCPAAPSNSSIVST